MSDLGRRGFLKTALLAAGAVPVGMLASRADEPLTPETYKPEIWRPEGAIDVTPGKPLSALVGIREQQIRFEGYVDHVEITMSLHKGGEMNVRLKQWPRWNAFMGAQREFIYSREYPVGLPEFSYGLTVAPEEFER